MEKRQYFASCHSALNGSHPHGVPNELARSGSILHGTRQTFAATRKSGHAGGSTFLLESRFIHPDEAAFVQGLYMTFYMARLVERAAELMSLPTASTSLPTPPIVLQETHPRRVAILRIINLLFIVLLEEFRVIRLYSSAPRSKNRQSCRKAPCHSPFLPCVPKTLKKHAPKEKMPGGHSAPLGTITIYYQDD